MCKELFFKMYEKWYEEALQEALEIFPGETEETIEIHEDGTVDFEGNFFLHSAKGTVTPWKESKYYVD